MAISQPQRVPKIKAMLMCQQIIREAHSERISLIGIIDAIEVRELPVRAPWLSIYVKLTEAQGDYAFKLEIVRRNDMVIVSEVSTGEVAIEDLMNTVEITMDLGEFVFDMEGSYDFRLWADDRFTDSCSLRVGLLGSLEGG